MLLLATSCFWALLALLLCLLGYLHSASFRVWLYKVVHVLVTRFFALENLRSKAVWLPLLMLNIAWNLTFMKQLQRGFEVTVIISMENREDLGNGEILVSIEEQIIIPLHVLCTLCPPSIPENMLLQFCAILLFSPGFYLGNIQISSLSFIATS